MMDATPLYNLSPALRLMGMGLVVALGPLAWLWLRHQGAGPARRLQALTLLTLFLTFDLVMFGAFTRLTDSGLGCPDWPGCYGQASPVGARVQIDAAEAAMPTGPVTHGKAWVEMIHRYLATGVGVLMPSVTDAPLSSSVSPLSAVSVTVLMKCRSEVLAATVVTHGSRWPVVSAPGPELPAEAATKTPAL